MPEPSVNPFASPAVQDASHLPDGLQGAVRIENGAELPHRCVFCNGVSNLRRSEIELSGRPADVRLWVCVLAVTFLLAPIAALLNRLRKRRVKFTASMCDDPLPNSECAKQRTISTEAQVWENLPVLGAGMVGFVQGSLQMLVAYFSGSRAIHPNDELTRLVHDAFFVIVMVICVFCLLSLAETDEKPNPLNVNVDDGFRLLGCGKEFLMEMPETLSPAPLPPTGPHASDEPKA